MGSSVAIVIPCYNEAKRLQLSQYKEYSDADRSHLFVFVNDGSTDTTLRVIQDLHQSHPQHCAYIDLPKNVGKAEAVRRGLLSAFDTNP
jgi:dolichyl-phosphate beta-glucosyltransferase